MSEAHPLFAVLCSRLTPTARRRSSDWSARRRIGDSTASTCSTSPAAKVSTNSGRFTTFLHATQIGLLDMSWNVLYPSCGGVLDANATLKTVRSNEYYCAFCAVSSEPTLDDVVEVSFTVSPRVRKIAAHNPDELPGS
jgi:hypothetical protein